MKKRGSSTITLQCVQCQGKKSISHEQARKLTEPPMCDTCFLPMVAVEAKVKK